MKILTKTIAVVNQKGGVGKTSVSFNLAGCLAVIFDRKTLVIDLDSQANLTDSFKIIENINETSYDLLTNNSTNITDTIYETNIKEIDIIPATVKLADVDLQLANKKGRVRALKSKLNKVKGDYEFIILDCPPSLSLTVINSLVASDSLIIPTEPGLYSLKGLKKLFQTFKTVKKKYNKDLKIEGVLLNRIDQRTNVADEFEKKLREQLGNNIFNTIIGQRVAVVQSQLKKLPLALYDESCKSTEEFINFTEEVISNG